MTITPRSHIYDDPHVRTLRKLANGISYPTELISMMSEILADNVEVIADMDHYILSGLSRLPDTDRHTVQLVVPRFCPELERTLAILSFNAKLRLVAAVSECLLRRELNSTLDDQWLVLASAWLHALTAQAPQLQRAA